MSLRIAYLIVGSAMISGMTVCWMTQLAASSNTTLSETTTATEGADDVFQTRIKLFLKQYCLDCHSGAKAKAGLALDVYLNESHARKDRKNWGAIQHVIAAGEMPPPDSKKPKPTKEEKEFVLNWIESTLTKVDCSPDKPKDPGRVTIRRLNRAEYNNTIRDLCGIDFKPADDFPADDVGYGFDNIGDVLSFQPILLEKYLAAADRILSTALTIPELPKADKQTFRPQQITTIPRSAKTRIVEPNGREINRIVFSSEGSASLPQNQNFTADGEYVLRFRGWGTQVGGEYPRVTIRVDGKDIQTFSVESDQAKPQVYEARARFSRGQKRIAVAFINEFKDDSKKAREFGLDFIEIEGPFNPDPLPESPSVKLLLIARPSNLANARQAAEKVLANFARRAYRRPVKPEEVTRLLKLFDLATAQGEPFEKAIQLPMKAVLISPHFLYRIEEDPKNPNEVRTLNDFEFATRLSYFLWSSMPDEELFALAEKQQLRNPAILETQVKRMLKDPKAKALSENFAGQWLQLRMLNTLTPDTGYFPAWNEGLKAAMMREAELYFEHIVQNDRSILELLDSNYTFVNAQLASHYGIKGITGNQFQKVTLPDNRRGGVITMASTLTVTSNPTRTSPVKRGKWILENILGTPPPPPAPDVPELPPIGQLKGTLRQQMEQHRADPACAVCHAKLDPLGFGLENFDAIGAWRTQDNKQDIDASGELPGGEKFVGPAQLRQVLLGKADQFRRCFAEKLLTFGLGRGLEYYDKCAVDEIVATTKAKNDTFSALVMAIVTSDPFQKRKGKRSE
jgi:hypothetical protein